MSDSNNNTYNNIYSNNSFNNKYNNILILINNAIFLFVILIKIVTNNKNERA